MDQRQLVKLTALPRFRTKLFHQNSESLLFPSTTEIRKVLLMAMVSGSTKSRKLLLLVVGWCIDCNLQVFVPRAPLITRSSWQTRWAEGGNTAGGVKRVLPSATRPANRDAHVFIPLDNYDSKLSDLFHGEDVLFIRGGVGVGKSTLQLDLARQYPQTFVSVPFAESSEESWRSGIIAAIENATGQTVARGPTRLEQALKNLAEAELTLVLDEAHTLFPFDQIRELLFKNVNHPKVVLFSASSEGSTSGGTTPAEITRKFFWIPPILPIGDDFISQLEEAGVCLNAESVAFFMKFCAGHRSIFMRAMVWVTRQQEAKWNYSQTVTAVRNSMDRNDWFKRGSIWEELVKSRAVKVNGRFSELETVPMNFVKILCEGPSALSSLDERREMTIHGFVVPAQQMPGNEEFTEVDWTAPDTQYAVSNPIMASYYRCQLERFRSLAVRVDPYIPVSCLDLLLRAIPYLTFARVVGFAPISPALGALSASDLPFEDQYSIAIQNALQELGYRAASYQSPKHGKVDVFVNFDGDGGGATFSMEGIMADRGQPAVNEHRQRFDNLDAYSKATYKALFIIGKRKQVHNRVLATRAEGVEIIGLVPDVSHTRYDILYRGAECLSRRTNILNLRLGCIPAGLGIVAVLFQNISFCLFHHRCAS